MNLTKTEARWRPIPLIVCNALAVLLIVSWHTPMGQSFWQQPDAWVFFTLNGSLKEGHAWQMFWAIANTKRFDVAIALIIAIIYFVHIFSGTREQIVQRTACGMLMAVSVTSVILFSKEFLESGRMGASDVLTPSIHLSDVITDFKFKDSSNTSFPGDHGISLIMFTTMIWYFAGRSYGLAVMALSIVMLLPRLVVGAHWLSDIAVGSCFISLIALGWILATPLHCIAIRLFTPLAAWSYGVLDKVLAFVTNKPSLSAAELAQTPVFIAKGFCMGSADIIPGVSGGTMALVLGIYERLLRAIGAVDRAWLRDIVHLRLPSALARNDLLFILPLAIGILSAIVFFTKIIPLPALVLSHPEIIYGLFFGLILASVFVLLGEIENYRASDLIPALAGVVLGLAVVNLVPVETPTDGWFLFLCGFVAICAMLLPGISGSFILLILGKYAYIINALGELNLVVIATFSAGALSGLLAFSKVIIWLLAHHHRNTLLVIKGILIGSLWVIWPFQERAYETVRGKEKLISSSPVWPQAFDSTVAWSLGLMLAGFALVVIIERLSRSSRVRD